MKVFSPSTLLFVCATLLGAVGQLQAQVVSRAPGQSSTLPVRPPVSWQPIGPGGGGWLTSITVVDDSAGTIYVTCDVGGVYKSSDHGASWKIKDEGLKDYYVESLAYDPLVKTTLYAATRGGIYKSTDGGELWVAKRNGFPPPSSFELSAPISDIVIDPSNPAVLYAGVGVPRAGYKLDGYAWQSAGVKGAIYKSPDFGENWTLIQGTGIDHLAMIYSLAIDPANSSVLFAATSSGVYKSTTAGATWSPINIGLPNPFAMALVIDPAQTDVIYTTLWVDPASTAWNGGVYKSVDGGQHWAPRNQGLPGVLGSEEGLTNNYPILVIDRQNPHVLYAGNNAWWPDPGAYKSTDGGDSWTWVTRFQPPNQNVDMGWITEHGPFSRCLAIDPIDSNRVLLGTPTHLFMSTNAGTSWAQSMSDPVDADTWKGRGFETTVVQDIAVDPTDSQRVYVGYWDMGFLKSVDGGNSFKRTFNGMTYSGNTFAIAVDSALPNIVYAATGWSTLNLGEVVKSTDFGETWTPITSGMPVAQIWSLALVPASSGPSGILYATSVNYGLFKTVDGGQNWGSVSSGLGVAGNLQARTVTVDPQDSRVLCPCGKRA